MTHDDRRTSLVVAVVGALAFAVLAAVLVPWDPAPGSTGTVPAAGSVFSADQIAAAEAFSREARLWSWSSLAVSLAIACCSVSPGSAPGSQDQCRDPGGSGWCWSSRARGARPAGHPAVRAAPARPPRRLRPVHADPLRVRARPREGRGRRHRRHGAGAAGAGRVRPPVAPGLAGDRRGSAGRLRPGRVPGLPRAGRTDLQRLRATPGRGAPLTDPRAGRRGGRGRARGAGRRRFAAYDDAQRLRVGSRNHASSRRLRQPGRGPTPWRRRSRWSPTSWPTRGTGTS